MPIFLMGFMRKMALTKVHFWSSQCLVQCASTPADINSCDAEMVFDACNKLQHIDLKQFFSSWQGKQINTSTTILHCCDKSLKNCDLYIPQKVYMLGKLDAIADQADAITKPV